MKLFAEYAGQACRLLLYETSETSRVEFASLMDKNFNLRRNIYGDSLLREANLRMVDIARKHGFAAKLAGSGGAVVGLWAGESDVNENICGEKLKSELKKNGFAFQWIHAQTEE